MTVSDLPAGSCVQVMAPNGLLIGYAILLCGVWDGWRYVPESPGRRLEIVCMGRSRKDSIKAVIAAHARESVE
jgi:hypothetical protein